MVDLLPEMERHGAFFGFEHTVGESTRLYGDLRYTQRRGTYDQGYQALYGTLGPGNPYYIPGVANTFGVLIDDRPLQRDVGVDRLAAVVGAGFDLGGSWRGGAPPSYSRKEQFSAPELQRNATLYDQLPHAHGRKNQGPPPAQRPKD